MHHLVIGAGNMGKKHAKVLKSFGDSAEMVDLGFKITPEINEFDSVYVCTPPETHLEIIKQAENAGAPPLFVEKPVSLSVDRITYTNISMVACNWRYCKCLPVDPQYVIGSSYPTASSLDHIHFVDLFWNKYGKPELAAYVGYDNGSRLDMFLSNANISAIIEQGPISTSAGGRQIHSAGPCDMFTRQAKVWRDCLKTGIESPNPIETASERTGWMLKKIGTK